MTENLQTIRGAFAAMRRDGPRRHRDIAKILMISEAELIAAHCAVATEQEEGALQAIRLNDRWSEQISNLESLGPVMALTRNASCVHEKTGLYSPVTQMGDIGLVQGEAIDLRIFYKKWHIGFAVTEKTARGTQHSLQYFDRTGGAIHKIFMRPESQLSAFNVFRSRFSASEQLADISVYAQPAAKPELSDSEINIRLLQQDWYAMRDTHDFFVLLKKHSLERLQSFRLIGAECAFTVRPAECRRTLSIVADKKIPIMVFVSNPGVIQIHTGVISNISVTQGWLNIIDPDFNLHLRQDHIASVWVVRKPTVDGVVTSMELFDHAGQLIAMLFGQRKPGFPENIQWRALLDGLFASSRPCAA